MGMVFALSVCSGISGEVYVYVGRVWVGGCVGLGLEKCQLIYF